METKKSTSYKIFKWALIIFIIMNALSLYPLARFYLKKTPKKFLRNTDVAQKLKINDGQNFAFMVMSDTSSGLFPMDATTLKIISRMNWEDRFKKIPIDFVANVGDVTYRGRPYQYRSYVKMRSMINYPVIDIPGNHDDDVDNGQKGAALFRKYCGEPEFSFVDRNSYFIVLDDSKSDLTKEQFDWLEKELKKGQSYRHIFIFIHKPPFNPYQQSWYRIETCPWSLFFMKMCERYKVRAVFSGHEYINRIAEFGGVTYVVSGGGGALLHEAPSWDNSFNHYVFVKINGDYVDYEIRRVSPPIWLYFTFYMWKDIIFWAKDVFF